MKVARHVMELARHVMKLARHVTELARHVMKLARHVMERARHGNMQRRKVEKSILSLERKELVHYVFVFVFYSSHWHKALVLAVCR